MANRIRLTPAQQSTLYTKSAFDAGDAYPGIKMLRDAFRLAGGNNGGPGGEYNIFDTPGQFYFRIFFDFSTPGGLLYVPSGSRANSKGMNTDADIKRYSSGDWASKDIQYADCALNYLMVNGEWERARMLEKFIVLLSNIASKSPWYFQSLEGLDGVMKCEGYLANQMTIPEQPPVIGIKCLQDAYDNRIGTLLDLYKAIAFSHRLDKVILPENLRLFNMYIYIFNVGLGASGWGDFAGASFNHDKIGEGVYVASSKLIELHGCQLDPNSNTTGYGSISNVEPFGQEYTIAVAPKKVYEQRYNELLMMKIGDMVMSDLFPKESDHSAWGSSPGSAIGSVVPENIKVQSPDEVASIHDPIQPINPDALDSFKGSNKNSGVTDQPGIGDKLVQKSLVGGKIGSIVNKAAGDLRTMGGAAGAVLNSYTNPGNIAEVALNATGDLIHKLTFGNLFHTTINDVVSNVSGAVSSISLNNVVDTAVHGGWTKTSRTSPSGRGIGGNLFQ